MRSRRYQVLILLSVVLMIISASPVAAAAPPHPTYCEEHPPIPVVDGDFSEWDLPLDFFSNIYQNLHDDEPVLGALYLRYDWYAGVLYFLVLLDPEADPPLTVDTTAALSHRITLDAAPLVDGTDLDSGTVPNIVWVRNAADEIVGFEAAAYAAQGSYEGLWVRTRSFYNGVSTVTGVCCLNLELNFPTAIDLLSFTAESAGPAIQLGWQTVTEVDNLGFNLYRAESAEGTRTQLNAALIPGQLPGSPIGGTYGFLDTTALRGITYYYWLEDVDLYGTAGLHGPATASLKAYVNILPGRPRPPAPVRVVQQDY